MPARNFVLLASFLVRCAATDDDDGMARMYACYTGCQAEAAEYQASVDLFLLTNNQYVDVASLGTLPRITGGSLYRYV